MFLLSSYPFFFIRLSLLAAWLLIFHPNQLSADRHLETEDEPKPTLSLIAGKCISDSHTFANYPSIAINASGKPVVAWIRHHADQGDEVVVKTPMNHSVETLTPQKGQYLRPVIAVTENKIHCAWTKTEHNAPSSIWHSVRDAHGWSPPARILPDEKRAHQNPEIAASKHGRIAVAFQLHTGKRYEICVQDTLGLHRISGDINSTNAWDPTITFNSELWHVAWSNFYEGDYDIYYQHQQSNKLPRRISSRGQYDLHPWIAPDHRGGLWFTWDAVAIPGHANSGSTTITGVNPQHKVPSNYGAGQNSWIEVRFIPEEGTLKTPGNPEKEIVPPQDYKTGHAALPKIAISADGTPWIIYRALHQQQGSWLPSGGTSYYWDLIARPYLGDHWGPASRFAQSDGYLEEAAIAAGSDTVWAAFGGEQRIGSRQRLLDHRQHQDKKRPDPHNHHSDYFGRVGCNGEVFLSRMPELESPHPFVMRDTPPFNLIDRDMPSRLPQTPYTVTVNDKTYTLFWGDTHRHSNVSRCSVGLEPTPDDLYRYGDDICNYDFFALSDHGEQFQDTTADSSQYYWWLNLKLADLYHIPEHMSVLYNYEWTMDFPHGHHNVLFPGRPTLRMDRTMSESDTLAKGWDTLANANMRAMTIPHTGADPSQGTAWEIQNDRFRRVVEIFQSCRGSYEHDGCPRQWHNTGNKKGFYWQALEKGYHLGVIASSDHGYGVAYACVYAEKNTREAIWQAIWDRRCYATTTYGLVLNVRSGNHLMGEEWSSSQSPTIDVYTKGPVPIRSVEIIGRSQVLHAEGSEQEPLATVSHRLRWTDPEFGLQNTEQWYYVRVILQNDEIAWSSPLWVTPLNGAPKNGE
ncbi:MAG: DUF3604 domain-containing protein [Planctomycetales bacterium]